jgi:hypothetical protein
MNHKTLTRHGNAYCGGLKTIESFGELSPLVQLLGMKTKAIYGFDN